MLFRRFSKMREKKFSITTTITKSNHIRWKRRRHQQIEDQESVIEFGDNSIVRDIHSFAESARTRIEQLLCNDDTRYE